MKTPCNQHDSYQPHCADCKEMSSAVPPSTSGPTVDAVERARARAEKFFGCLCKDRESSVNMRWKDVASWMISFSNTENTALRQEVQRLLAAEEQRVRDISQLTQERDAVREEMAQYKEKEQPAGKEESCGN